MRKMPDEDADAVMSMALIEESTARVKAAAVKNATLGVKQAANAAQKCCA